MRPDTDFEPRAAIPADVEAPDKLIYGLTARQVAILATAAVACYGLWRTIGGLVPPQLMAALLVPVAGVAAGLALGRRDGLSMDAWLLAGVRHRRGPKRAVPAPGGVDAPPDWAPQLPGPAPAVLRLPAQAITDAGVLDLGGSTAASMVAATTVNIGLRTGEEQGALLGAYGRWLNGLTGPVQVVVSAQRADLTGYATRIAEAAAALSDPALADAAVDYAEFLLDVAAHRDPLCRTVTVVCAATAARGADAEAMRRGEQAAAALSALGAATRVLDGPCVTAVVTAATDPYQYGDASWPRARPDAAVTMPDGSGT